MEWDGGGEGECAIQNLYHAVLEKKTETELF